MELLFSYHYVFCVKYRRKIFNDENVQKDFIICLNEVIETENVKLLHLEILEDTVILGVKAHAKISAHDIVAKIKNNSSKKIRENCDELSHLPSIWTRNYKVSPNILTNEEITSFINAQSKNT